MYGYSTHDLKPGGGEELLTLDNAEEYVELVTDFCLHSGIQRQAEAFKGRITLHFRSENLKKVMKWLRFLLK